MKIRNILFVLLAYLTTTSLSFADQVIFQPGSSQGKDMWLSSVYNNVAVDDDKLQVGGWGDWYRMFIEFDLTGLPQIATSAEMWMYAYDRGDSSMPVAMPLYLLTTPWSETTQNYYDPLSGYYAGTMPAPTSNSWYGLNITSIYNGWKNGTYTNNGFVFLAASNNNEFNVFRSSDYVADPLLRPKLVITYDGVNLSFPLDCSTPNCSGAGNINYSAGAYTPQVINSVVDHDMDYVYTDKDGVIVSFTGETFKETPTYPSGGTSACYPKVNNATWSSLLTSIYKGTGTAGTGGPNNCLTGVALNYEAHPGYDYKAAYGTTVKAASAGTVVNFNSTGDRCIPKGLSAGCAAWGAVGIKDGNGYVTQYLHLSTILVSSGDVVTKGQVIGYSGDTAPGSLPAHLHFEVLKQVPGSSGTLTSDYKVVDPYGWQGEYGADPLEAVTGIKNVCLWQNCQ